MTEEIIIDGVNVAGCSRFNKETGYCNGGYRTDEEPYCQCFTCDCKRLQRLEQENRELKDFCIELEKQKERQHNQWFERCTENHNEDSKIIDNYRSALEEIWELSNINKEWAVFMKPIDRLEKINKIVSEVLQ